MSSANAIACERLRTLWLPKAGWSDSWFCKQVAAQSLEAGVALPFLEVDRLRPAEPPGRGDFVIPVRSFHEADRDRGTAAVDPGAKHLELALGIGVISLDDDADVGPVAKFGFLEHPAKQLVAERAIGVLLHVDVNLSASLAGEAQDRPQPRRGALDRLLGVNGFEVGRQAREFEREIHAGNRAVLIAVDQRDFGRVPDWTVQVAHERQAGLLVEVGFELADDCFAEQVGRERQPLPAQADDRFGCLGRRGAGDEFSGHDAGRKAGCPGEPAFTSRARGRELDRQPQPPGDMVARFCQVFGEVAADCTDRCAKPAGRR